MTYWLNAPLLEAEKEFEKLDTDHDGHLNQAEIDLLLASLGSSTLNYGDILQQVSPAMVSSDPDSQKDR